MTAMLVLVLVALAYALVADRLERWSVGAPLVFMAAGALLAPVVHEGTPSAHNHAMQWSLRPRWPWCCSPTPRRCG